MVFLYCHANCRQQNNDMQLEINQLNLLYAIYEILIKNTIFFRVYYKIMLTHIKVAVSSFDGQTQLQNIPVWM